MKRQNDLKTAAVMASVKNSLSVSIKNKESENKR